MRYNKCMHVPLTEDLMERLRDEASRRGVEPPDCARQLIEESLSGPDQKRGNGRLLDLLDQWDIEDQTDDPAEIARRQHDFEEFKEAINASHSSKRKIYP